MSNCGLHTRLVVLLSSRNVRVVVFRFLVAVFLGMVLAGTSRGATTVISGGFTFVGNFADGSHYTYSVTATHTGHTASTNSWLWFYKSTSSSHSPKTAQYGLFEQWNPQGSQTYTGSITVAPGEYWGLVGQYLSSPGVGAVSADIWTAVGVVGTGTPKQITYALAANTSANAVTYGIIRKSDGALLAEMNMPAGSAGADFTVTGLPAGASGSDYQLAFWIPGVGMVAGGSGIWALTGTAPTVSGLPPVGAETVQYIDVGVSTTQVVDQGTTPTSAQKVNVSTPTAVPNVAVKTTGSGGTVWNIAPSGGGLSDTTFQEGVNKIVDGQVQQSGYLKKVADGWDGIGTAKADGDAAVAGADAQAATAKTASDAAITGFPTTPTHSVTTSVPQWSYTMPASMGGKTVNMNPFTEDRFGPMASWLKQALFWWFGVLFAKHVIECAMPFGRGLAQVQQAKGNPVVAGTGAQATALVAAVAMSAIIVAGVGVMVAVMLQNFGLGSITSVWATNPYAGLPGGIAYVIDQVFPLSAWLILILGRPLVWPVFFKIYLGVATLVRFVVP